ncbi:MAG: hypothetical protein FJ399_12445 [Verrucomicrobia bacterium]|nr:hypothetical protein [Verrucomicrobiota bacterium]
MNEVVGEYLPDMKTTIQGLLLWARCPHRAVAQTVRFLSETLTIAAAEAGWRHPADIGGGRSVSQIIPG